MRYGFKVISVDASENALKATSDLAQKYRCAPLAIHEMKVDEDKLLEVVSGRQGSITCIYARFFLHAITRKEQIAFFDTLQRGLVDGDILAFEFRTTDDEIIKKEAKAHFRRYQTEKDVEAQLVSRGFKKRFSVEGRGMAKYKAEDAIVARCIYQKGF